MVRLIVVIKDMLHLPFRKVCESLELSYSTFMRWKGRSEKGETIVKKPGPQKEEPLQVEGLMDRIQALDHRRKRTHGVGSLFEEYKNLVSRRSFQELVSYARDEVYKAAQAALRHIRWIHPGVVYAMDDSYYGRDDYNKKLFLHSVRDMASRYQFQPLAGNFASGKAVAENLEGLFHRYGTPLIVKRDGGSNLKHEAVEEVLSRHMVIPLESPRYYPPYNGAVEKGQFEQKTRVRKRQGALRALPRRHFQVYAEAATCDLNHTPRRSLGGKVSCQVFFSEKGGVTFSKRRRREIFEWIEKLSSAIMVEIGKPGKRVALTAWRWATESWLHINGFIEVSMNGKVLPIFSPEMAH